MKKALYYAIRVMTLYPYVVAVTSEKPTRHAGSRWYGRDVRYDTATNGTAGDLRGKFDTQEAAEAKLAQVQHVTQAYSDLRAQAALADRMLREGEKAAMDAVFAGREQAPPPQVITVREQHIAAHNVEWCADGVRGGHNIAGALAAAGELMDVHGGGIVVVLPRHKETDA